MTRKKTSRSTSRKTTSRRSSRTKRRGGLLHLTAAQKSLIIGITIVFAAAILFLSLLAPNQGQLTAWLATLLWQAFGWGSYAVPLIVGAIGLYNILVGMDQPPTLPIYRLLGFLLLFLVFEGLASMLALTNSESPTDYWQLAQTGLGGGYLGGALAYALTALVGNIGAIFTLAVGGVVGLVLVSGLSRQEMMMYARAAIARDAAESDNLPPTRPAIRVNPDRRTEPAAVQLPLVPETEKPEEPAPRRGRRQTAAATAATVSASPPVVGTEGQPSQSQGYTWTLPAIADILESGADLDLNNVAIREQVEIIEHTLESFGAPATVVEINQGPTITQFGVEPNYIEMRNGRRTKVKVGKISSLADDLALALAARSIRIQAPVPGKSYVGIEVPNPFKNMVSLRDVMESGEYQKVRSPLAMGLGQNVSGQPIVADLATMPHLLIAGTTGSGKSVCVNSIITCLLLQNTPDDLKLVMVDPKRVELTGYNGIPHLAAPVVVEMDRVVSTLQWALREMDARYKKFAEMGARHIGEYNKKIARKRDVVKMPQIVIIIDELADLMMLAPEDTERAVTRLAQMARATGIHMVIATQRPSVDVVTGLIKANFPARIAFAVASGTDSRVILDSTGAERLLGQGDMLFQKPDAAAPLRLQGCFVSDVEIERLIGYWKQARRSSVIAAETASRPRSDVPAAAFPAAAVAPAETAQEAEATPAPRPNGRQEPAGEEAPLPPAAPGNALQQPLWEALQEEEEQAGYADELMPEAIALVRKLNKASTSLLQRRFRIGYTRAARMIDAMEEAGIIGPPTGTSKAREVLSPPEGSEPDGPGSAGDSAEAPAGP